MQYLKWIHRIPCGILTDTAIVLTEYNSYKKSDAFWKKIYKLLNIRRNFKIR